MYEKKVKWLKSRNAVSKKSSPWKKNYRELKMNMELKLLRQKVCNHLIPTLGTPLMVGLHTLNQHYLNQQCSEVTSQCKFEAVIFE